MKAMPYLLVIFLSILCFKVKAQQSLDSQLRNFPFENFLNKPIDSLIANIPLGYDTAFAIGGTGNTNRGASLQINYSPNNEYWIYINITDSRFITINKNLDTKPEVAWPLSLLRKEKIGSIVVGRGGYEIIKDIDIY